MTYPAISTLVPHRPPMLWLDAVIAHEPERVCCRLTIRDEHPFVRNGHVDPLISIEWMAQAIAAMAGLRDLERGEPVRWGYLIAVPEATFETEGFKTGDTLDIVAARVWGDDQLAAFSCAVMQAQRTLARAQLSVYRGEKGSTVRIDGGPS